jgi:hypothetical protein
VSTSGADADGEGPIDGCRARKMKKASEVQNQPILTKKTLKRLRF